MKKNILFLLVLLAVGSFILVGVYLGRNTPTQAINVTNAACSISTTAVIASAQGDVYAPSEIVAEDPDLHYLAYYSVDGEQIEDPVYESIPDHLLDEQKDASLQNEGWEVFTDLISPEDRQMVTRYNVFTDGYSNTLAAVDQVKDEPSLWILEMDIADLEDRDALLFTVVHEYAHLLTLNASQVEPDADLVNDPFNQDLQKEKAAACSTYFAGNGCSYSDSYIHAFYQRFWLDIADEWARIDALAYTSEDLDVYYEALYSFYKTHQDQFVDDYATTHPAEDIAESFTYFVFGPKPTGMSIKEQKIAFFYEYPELIALRERILQNACSLE